MKPGWYAILRCWDSEEGVFPGIAELGSPDWDSSVIARSPEPFGNSDDAQEWADTHDPDFPQPVDPSTLGWVYL